jgi:hypothetical protein
VTVDLAPLPREQIGPFLLLGLEKDASPEQIEANWAKRVIWARKGQIRVPLEDVNWAREVINDRERRVRADASSFNADTADGVLRKLEKRYGGAAGGRPAWQPLDVEKDLSAWSPAVEVPDAAAVRASVPLPEVPDDVPAVRGLLDEVARQPIDPWALFNDPVSDAS